MAHQSRPRRGHSGSRGPSPVARGDALEYTATVTVVVVVVVAAATAVECVRVNGSPPGEVPRWRSYARPKREGGRQGVIGAVLMLAERGGRGSKAYDVVDGGRAPPALMVRVGEQALVMDAKMCG